MWSKSKTKKSFPCFNVAILSSLFASFKSLSETVNPSCKYRTAVFAFAPLSSLLSSSPPSLAFAVALCPQCTQIPNINAGCSHSETDDARTPSPLFPTLASFPSFTTFRRFTRRLAPWGTLLVAMLLLLFFFSVFVETKLLSFFSLSFSSSSSPPPSPPPPALPRSSDAVISFARESSEPEESEEAISPFYMYASFLKKFDGEIWN